MNKKQLFGKRFKAIRKKFGYTQDKMAEIAGIEPQSISKIESGKNFPLLSNLDKIAIKLGIELEDFFYYDHKVCADDLKADLIRVFDSLDQTDKEKLLRIAKIFRV